MAHVEVCQIHGLPVLAASYSYASCHGHELPLLLDALALHVALQNFSPGLAILHHSSRPFILRENPTSYVPGLSTRATRQLASARKLQGQVLPAACSSAREQNTQV